MEAIIGLAVLVATFLLLRRLVPRPDRAPPAVMRIAGADTALAVLLTLSVALGVGLTIEGGFGLWQDALEFAASLR